MKVFAASSDAVLSPKNPISQIDCKKSNSRVSIGDPLGPYRNGYRSIHYGFLLLSKLLVVVP
jgi:hypothetical protein